MLTLPMVPTLISFGHETVFMSQMQGAGTGLVGLVCGALGASEVVLHGKWSK